MTCRTIVVTGTDTEVGKTKVTAAIGRALSSRGRAVVAVKPIESGCSSDAATLAEDGVTLAAATGQREPREALLRLKAPITPAAAAEAESKEIDFSGLVDKVRRLRDSADVLLVEGAGGLLSPLTWRHSTLDLATQLRAEVILVAPNKLGTLNHVRLALEVLAAKKSTPIAVVLSMPEEPDTATLTNAASLRRLSRMPPVHCLARIEELDAAAAAVHPIIAALRL
jgi:dethiobiotin synthase